MKRETDLIPITDLYVIAYLLSNGEKYRKISRPTSNTFKKTTFYFPLEARRLIDEFFNGQECSAIAFKNAIENVKSLLFDFK